MGYIWRVEDFHQYYGTIKALHIIFVVSWFAALFYIVRLFIYHTEAQERNETEREILQTQYKLMQRRLWYIIGWPAMILTVVFGVWLLVESPLLLKKPFMHIKLALVGTLVIYHLYCEKILRDLRKDKIKWKSLTLRLWNELATVFLVSIVFLIELGDHINWIWGVVGFVGFGLTLMLIVRLVKRLWKKPEK